MSHSLVERELDGRGRSIACSLLHCKSNGALLIGVSFLLFMSITSQFVMVMQHVAAKKSVTINASFIVGVAPLVRIGEIIITNKRRSLGCPWRSFLLCLFGRFCSKIDL